MAKTQKKILTFPVAGSPTKVIFTHFFKLSSSSVSDISHSQHNKIILYKKVTLLSSNRSTKMIKGTVKRQHLDSLYLK